MYRFGRPKRIFIKRDIRTIMNTHSAARQWITIKRQVEAWDPRGEQLDRYEEVYTGDALVRPASGSVQAYGLGRVENFSLLILINGVHPIKQGDVVTINDGRDYEVQFPPVWFDAFTELRLETRSQIAQPTV